MKSLKIKQPYSYYAEDVKRIVNVCKNNGFYISDSDAKQAWENYSDSFAASWLILPESDSDLFYLVEQECEEMRGDIND